MSLYARLDALKERHASLESRIFDEDNRPQPDADIIECAHRPQYLQRSDLSPADPAGRSPLSWLRGRRVFAFSGIATPESFEKFLRDLGALVVGRERFLDHYRYQPRDLAQLQASGFVIMRKPIPAIGAGDNPGRRGFEG